MRNLLLFTTVLLTLAIALFIGMSRFGAAEPTAGQAGIATVQQETPVQQRHDVPLLPLDTVSVPERENGRVQVLNGTNIDGAGQRMFDFLQSKMFDVRGRPQNAQLRNYPATMVISRIADMSVAREVDKHLKTGKVVLMRNNDQEHDVTVIVGWDFEEIAKRERIK